MKMDTEPKSFPVVNARWYIWNNAGAIICIASKKGAVGAAVACGGIQTYFLHDVIDPGRRAIAEVGTLGIPVA